jgi:uncharacterized membrane protein (UPF0127 family)
MRNVAFALLGLALGAIGCHRAPEEPVTVTTAGGSRLGESAPTQVVPAPLAIPTCPPDPEPHLSPLPTATVSLPEAAAGPATLDVEIARTPHDSERGLMYRRSMPEEHGMVFELDRRDHSFWMHNTCIGLDLLYIDGDHIAGIVEDAPTLNDEERSVGRLADTVLEVNAGWCKRHGVRPGQRVVLPPRPR